MAPSSSHPSTPRGILPLEQQLEIARSLLNASSFHDAHRLLADLAHRHPVQSDVQNLLSISCYQTGLVKQALVHAAKAVELEPRNCSYLNNLGGIHQGLGHIDQALACYMRALSLEPRHIPSLRNITACLIRKGLLRRAHEYCMEWLKADPDSYEARISIGYLLSQTGSPDTATLHYRAATRLRPKEMDAWYGLGGAYLKAGEAEDAIQSLSTALGMNDSDLRVHSLLINALGYSDTVETGHIQDCLSRFNAAARKIGCPVPGAFANLVDAEKKLRVGYLLPDLILHSSLVPFVKPVFNAHDHKSFEIYGYYTHAHQDGVTQSIAALADAWIPCAQLNDKQLHQRIVSDEVDILVDLIGHFFGNRLPVLAMKPAPLIVSWFGYPGDIGLGTVDYKFSDKHLDPGDQLDSDMRVTKTVHLAAHYCFAPPVSSPTVSMPPVQTNGCVTFGVFGNGYKINRHCISMWSRILQAMPDARLLIADVNTERQRDRLLTSFIQSGIAPERLRLIERKPFEEYMRLHGEVDIVLDTYPFTGGLSSLLALWMGTPMITLRGSNAMQRQGAMILSHLGLEHLIAGTPDQYVEYALCLASDRARMAELRSTMRARFSRSVLTDAAAVTRQAESEFRLMWRDWCRRSTP